MREFGEGLQLGRSAIGVEVWVGNSVQRKATLSAATHQGGEAADSGEKSGDARPKGRRVGNRLELHFVQ